MGLITGRAAALQLGIESTWGTGVVPTVQLAMLSESIKYNLNKKASEVLQSGITQGLPEIFNYKVDGDISIELTPKNAAYLIGLLLGDETDAALEDGTAGVYKHAFNCLAGGSANSLPSCSLTLDRVTHVKQYTGVKVNSLSLSANAEDYVVGNFGIVGKSETTDVLESLSLPTEKPYTFVGGSVTVDSVDLSGSVESVSVDIQNNLDVVPAITRYIREPEPLDRGINFSLECLFDSSIETLREDHYKTNASVAVYLEFVSSSLIETAEYHRFDITIPVGVITALHPSVGGKDKIKATIEGYAADNSGDPIEIDFYDDLDTEYLS